MEPSQCSFLPPGGQRRSFSGCLTRIWLAAPGLVDPKIKPHSKMKGNIGILVFPPTVLTILFGKVNRTCLVSLRKTEGGIYRIWYIGSPMSSSFLNSPKHLIHIACPLTWHNGKICWEAESQGFCSGSTNLLSGFVQVKPPLKSNQVELGTLQGPSSCNIQEFHKSLANVLITPQIRALVQCGHWWKEGKETK